MRINHNISALNTYRQLSINTTAGANPLRNCHQVSELTELVMTQLVLLSQKK